MSSDHHEYFKRAAQLLDRTTLTKPRRFIITLLGIKSMRYVALFMLLVSSALAHLGDMREELVARFGPVQLETSHSILFQDRVHAMGPSLTFVKDGWRLRCDLVEGRCVRISYVRRGGWTNEQMAALLDDNAQGAKWQLGIAPSKTAKYWDRTDQGKATWQFAGRMDFISADYFKAKAKLEEELKQKSQGKPKA